MTARAQLEAPDPGEGLEARRTEMRDLVAVLEAAAVTAAREGRQVDAAALAQARGELEALGGALSAVAYEGRAAAAQAARDRLAAMQLQIGARAEAMMQEVDAAEAAARAMTAALVRAETARALLVMDLIAVGKPFMLHRNYVLEIISRALAEALQPITGGGYSFGAISLPSPGFSPGRAWRTELAETGITNHLADVAAMQDTDL